MRVCVLTQACPACWTQYYVRAFRRAHDVVVVGPPASPENLAAWGRAEAGYLAEAPDVPHDLEADFDLEAALPAGWQPDLVVGIAGIGGGRVFPGAGKLTCPTAFISVDTWQCLNEFRDAVQYDFVFAAQQEFVEHLHFNGSRYVSWLPLAADPEFHYPADCVPTHDVAFAGITENEIYFHRIACLNALGERHSVLAIRRAFGEELCQAYALAHVAFNYSAVQELNMRVFENMAMGRPVLTNRAAERNGLFDLFEPGEYLLPYEGSGDVASVLDQALASEAGVARAGEAARRLALERHTYDHRARVLVDTVMQFPMCRDAGRASAAYQGERIDDYLPTFPGETVDYGVGLALPGAMLKERGVTSLTGITHQAIGPSAHRLKYDEIIHLMASPIAQADTVVVASTAKMMGTPVDEVLNRACTLLRPGGILVMRLRGSDLSALGLAERPAALEAALGHMGFQLRFRGADLPGGGFIFQARKRVRPLADIVRQVHGRIALPGRNVDEIAAKVPRTW